MKQTNFKKEVHVLFLSLFFIMVFTLSLTAQVNELDTEILVYFLPDSLEIDKGEQEIFDAKKLKIKSMSLDKAIKKIEFKSIKKAFPDFNEADTIKTRKDGKKIKLLNISRVFKLKLHKKDDVESVIDILSKEKGVLFAIKHSNVKLHTNDIQYPNQWHLNNTSQSGGTNNADINAPEAWSIFNGSSSVKLGIIDTGVETNHDDLEGKSSGDLPENYPYNDYAHGTHVAGIAGAKHGNIGEVKGVDANVQIISKKVFSGYSFNDDTQQDEMVWAGDDVLYNKIVSAVNEGADVLNNSYGGTDDSRLMRSAFAYAYNCNVTSVVSMGNDNSSSPKYPAAYGQGIIAVGATDHNDVRASYSNKGNHIDVAAPGGDGNSGESKTILSTWRGNLYHSIDGTSMAAPIVSGIATLLKGYNTNLYNDDIENIIKLSAEDKNYTLYPGWDQFLGEGRVNAKKALEHLQTPYVLEHHSATDAILSNLTGPIWVEFYGVDGVSDGGHAVYRYEARKTVNLNAGLIDRHVWGRGPNTDGFSCSSDEELNFGMGFCEVISTTSTSATLRTYIYTENPYAPFPAYIPNISNPMFLRFEYSVSGYTLPAPTITMSGGYGANPTLSFSYNESVVDHFVLKKEYDFGSGFYPHYINPASSPYTDSNVEITRFGGDLVARYSVKVVDVFGNESNYSNTVSTSGNSLWKSEDKEEIKITDTIKEYALNSNYPNPFNPTTQISYQIPEDSFVNLIVYNALGQEVTELVNQHQSVGKYSVKFNASNLPSGVYIYKLQAGEFSSVKKMLLTK